MAFVGQSERKLVEVRQDILGPGAYFQEDSLLRQENKEAYAPFLSTSKRQSISQPGKLIPPGPGQYQVSTKIVQPLIQTLSNSHSIIVKINSTGTVPFKSTHERFDGKYSEVPGPGSYTPQHTSALLTRRNSSDDKSSLNSSALHHIRQMNKKRRNPTIPNRVTSLTASKEIPQQKDPKELEQERGPGKYEMPGGFGQGRGAQWGKDHIKRFSMHVDNEVGPGKYTPGDGKKPQYVYNPSSTFVSETIRTHFDNIYYKTNQDFKAKIRMKSNYKAAEPGPGQYDCNVSAIQLKNTPFAYQFFGSTVERFGNQDASVVGPGIYKLPSDFDHKRATNKAVNSFNSTGQRDNSFLDTKTVAVPGPGSYTEQLIRRPKLYGKSRRVQMFGVAERRFADNKEVIEKPGPGAYFDEQQNAYKDISMNGRETTGSIFKSSTIRNCFGDQKKDTTPFGAYQVHNFDLSNKLEKQKVFIQNLRKIDVEKAPFDSSHSRFPHYEPKTQQQQKTAEEMKRQEEQLRQRERRTRSVITSPEVSRPAFNTATERFPNGKKGTPSVGSYKLESSWDKRSFNLKYQQSRKDEK